MEEFLDAAKAHVLARFEPADFDSTLVHLPFLS